MVEGCLTEAAEAHNFCVRVAANQVKGLSSQSTTRLTVPPSEVACVITYR